MGTGTRIYVLYNFYRPQRSWGKVIFSEACVNNSVHRGGVCGCWGGCGFIRGACMVLFGGVCVVLFGGRAWFYLGGMRGFIQGGCPCFFQFFRYNEIRSMSGRYASYWNAFLYEEPFTLHTHFQVLKPFQVEYFNGVSIGFRHLVLVSVEVSLKGFCIILVPIRLQQV